MRAVRRSALVPAAVFACAAVVFSVSRVHQVADSEFSMLLSDSLLRHGTFTLDHYALPRFPPDHRFGDYAADGPAYQLEYARGHLYYYFPPGSSILSAPFVGIFELAGVSPVTADGSYDHAAEETIETTLAPLVAAAAVLVFFLTARLLLPAAASAGVALVAAFGTQVYSTASRALWSDTWGALLVACAVYLLLAHRTGRHRLRPELLATLMAWAYFVRPTFAVHAAAIAVYLFVVDRRLAARYAAAGAAWFAGFATWSWLHYRELVPSYYRATRLGFEKFWVAVAGNLVSPSRGLLVYVPMLLAVAYAAVRYRRRLRYPSLAVLVAGIAVAHVVVVAGYRQWWGGYSFGARLTTGLVPWLLLLAVLSLEAIREVRAWRVVAAVAAVPVAFSVFVNTLGATATASWAWNALPVSVDADRSRLWDWRHPQFLAAFQRPPACLESAERFVRGFYSGSLRRPPRRRELDTWVPRLKDTYGTERLDVSRQLGEAVFASPEYAGLRTSDERYVADLYAAYLGRRPDVGSRGWLRLLADTGDRAAVRDGFVESDEFERRVRHLC